MASRTALIATVFQESESIRPWLDALAAQTCTPDEFVIVDAESTDGTVELITSFPWPEKFPKPRVIVQRCNIAEGRNLAMRSSTADIIVSSDAGSFPVPEWFQELTQPFLDDPTVDAVGGGTILLGRTPTEEFLVEMEGPPAPGEGYYPSSRNIAIRRAAWESVGGYPEWLTLAGEDALYNYELHAAGVRFFCSTTALVEWPVRPTIEDYYKLLYRNAFGAAEARMFAPYFWRRILLTICPFLLLLSRHRFRHLKFRFRKNASSALGWLAGKLWGKTPPPDWKEIDGLLLSPEAQRTIQRRQRELDSEAFRQ